MANEIRGVYYGNAQEGFTVGQDGVTRIDYLSDFVAGSAGMMDAAPVFKGDKRFALLILANMEEIRWAAKEAT